MHWRKGYFGIPIIIEPMHLSFHNFAAARRTEAPPGLAKWNPLRQKVFSRLYQVSRVCTTLLMGRPITL